MALFRLTPRPAWRIWKATLEDRMKIQDWSLKPLKPKGMPVADDEPLADDIFVSTIVATRDNKQVVLHRVTKVNPDGSEEVFIIKASPKILATNH
jgi:hypothetical protein